MWQTAQPFDLWIFQEQQSCSAFEWFNAILTKVCVFLAKCWRIQQIAKMQLWLYSTLKHKSIVRAVFMSRCSDKSLGPAEADIIQTIPAWSSVIPEVQLRKRKEGVAMGCDTGLLVELENASSSPDQHIYLEGFATLFTFKCLKIFSCHYNIYNLVTRQHRERMSAASREGISSCFQKP